MIGLLAASATAPPLTPDAAAARRQLLLELSKPEYQTGKSNIAQQIAQAISDWIASLRVEGGPGGLSPVGLLIVIVAIAVVLLLAFLIFGLPRLNRRGSSGGTLFGDDDSRDADALRAAAAKAAEAGDYSTAIAEGFRAIARGLSQRGVVTTFPGTTATGFAHQAGAEFPAAARDLDAAAHLFDAVRYLDRTGDVAGWQAIRDLDRTLRSARPTTELVAA